MERYREYYDTFWFLNAYESDDDQDDLTFDREEELPF
jgi:hypothetical protein